MKVLMIPSFLKNKNNKSLGSFFLEQAIAIQKLGNEVTIIFPDTYSLKHIDDYLKYEERNEQVEGVKIIRNKFLSPLKYNFYGDKKVFVKGCLKLIEKYNIEFDIIHAQNCFWAGEAARVISKKYDIPYVVTEHSSWFALYNNKKNVINDAKLIFNEAASVICVSSQLKNDISNYYKNPIVIGNIVDTDTFNFNKSKKERNNFTFVTVAFLQNEKRVKLKGIRETICAFNKLSEKYDFINLKIIGVPENSPLIKECKNMKNIFLLPILNKQEISKEFNKSNCFILLSNYETFGLSYAEAMAAGMPVIATNVGIISEIINEKSGIICNKDNTNDIIEAMNYIIKNKDNYNQKVIRKKITDKYSLEIISKKIINEYNKAI